MNPEQQYYFDMGVKLGELVFAKHLNGDSYSASKYTPEHAAISLKNAMVANEVIFHHQEIIKHGIVLGVKTAGVKIRRSFNKQISAAIYKINFEVR